MFWSKEEEILLKQLYPTTSNKELEKIFTRSIKAIKCHATEVLKISKNMAIPRCVNCEKPISNLSHYQRFCNDECRELYFRKQRAKRNLESLQKRRTSRKCLQCHKMFTPLRSKGEFCSSRCQTRYWRETHKEQYQLTLHSRWEKNYLKDRAKRRKCTIKSKDGVKSFTVIKRDFPADGCCELCGSKPKRLPYHHWGEIQDYSFVKGIWVCINCHKIIENPENTFHILTLFAQKKEIIEQEVVMLKNNAEKFYPRVLSSKKTV